MNRTKIMWLLYKLTKYRSMINKIYIYLYIYTYMYNIYCKKLMLCDCPFWKSAECAWIKIAKNYTGTAGR